jgi:hypothetical protein
MSSVKTDLAVKYGEETERTPSEADLRRQNEYQGELRERSVGAWFSSSN